MAYAIPTPPSSAERTEPTEGAQPAAHALVRALVAAGVDTFFGIPGGPISPVFDAVLQVPGARLIESRHEASAAFAAADYQRASGRTPAVLVTAGPGATNVVTGVASAHLERVPLLVIGGDVAWSAAGGKLLQDSGPEGIDFERLLGRFARAAVRVARPETIVSQGLCALAAAEDPSHPGPALLVLPIQHGRVEIEATPVARPERSASHAAPADAIERSARWLAAARRPLLVLGAACRPQATRVRMLVETLRVPFVTTPQAKGVIDEHHPHSLRHGGLAASTWARAYTAQGVDAALVLGSDLDDCAVGPTPYVAPDGRLVHVDLDAGVFGRNLKTALGVACDLGAFADGLRTHWKERGLRADPRAHEALADARARSPFEQAPAAGPDAPIAPQQAIAELESAMPPGSAFITDIGEHMLFALHHLTARDAEAFTIHLGLGSMGSGIAGAVGLSLGRPQRPVACICGDGGMQMLGMEALVALEHRLPIVYAVFNDARYNMVYHGYKQIYGRQARWETRQIDFVGWARSLGLQGVLVERPGELDRARLESLLAARTPVVLDIRIDREQRFVGGGRNESLRHMSLPAEHGQREER